MPVAYAGKDTNICNKTQALLHGNVSNASGTVSYLWNHATTLGNPNAATTAADPGATTLYTLTVDVNYGSCRFKVTDDVLVTMLPAVHAFAGNDTNAVYGSLLQLQAAGGVNYLWTPAGELSNAHIANPVAKLYQDTKLVVVAYDIAGCSDSDTILVKIYKDEGYYVPSAFSPNGDGVNEIFRPVPVGIVSTDWFRIFNRYGELVFETHKFMDGWDGTYKGIKQQQANYVWVLKGKSSTGRVITMKGNVLLLR